MGSWAGVLVIGVAVVLVIMGIQGSWAKFFPWIMSNTSTSSTTPAMPNQPPMSNGQCPPGYTLVNGSCQYITSHGH